MDYKRCDVNVKIICRDHGVFEQQPSRHVNRGDGCPKCSGMYRRTLFDFLEEAKEIHGNKYDYSLITGENFIYSMNKEKILCNTCHFTFEQFPESILT
jgi:hypothetical protein